MGLYERLMEEAARLPEVPDWEDEPGGGYVTAEELRKEAWEEYERRRKEIRALSGLVTHGLSGIASAYALGALKRRYPSEYAWFLAAKRTRGRDGAPSEDRPVRGRG